MTLIFNQAQVGAVYSATRGSEKGQVFLSPFVGRLDDIGVDGINYIKNVLDLYKNGDGHVEVLAASIRSYEHFLACLKLQADIVTVPGKILYQWSEDNFFIPDEKWEYRADSLEKKSLEDIDLDRDWREFDIRDELTKKGIEKFVIDWNNLLK